MENPSPMSIAATTPVTPVEPALSQTQSLLAQRAADAETISVQDFAKGVVDNDWMWSNIKRIEAEQGFADDPAWIVPRLTDEKAWEGVAPEDRRAMMDSRSAEHFAWMKEQYTREKATEAELAKAGLWAIPGRLALNMADPMALVASVATGSGIAAKASRLTNAVRAGLVAGASNAAIEGVVAKGSQSLDGSDVVLGAVAGFAIGAPIGAAFRPVDHEAIQRALAGLARERQADLLVEQAAKDGIKLDKTAVLAKLEEDERKAMGSFGADSAGAARAFNYDPVRDTFVETDEKVGQMAYSFLPTYAGVLRGHSNPTVRDALGPLVDDPIGTADGSVSRVGATQEKFRLEQVHRERFNREANLAFEEWLERQGHTVTRAFVTTELPKLRDDFMRQVGRAMFGDADPTLSAEARKLADAIKTNHFKPLGDDLYKEGVLDELLDDYTPVRWNAALIDDYIEGLGTTGRRFGKEAVEEVFYQGFKNTELATEIRVSTIQKHMRKAADEGREWDDAAKEAAAKAADATVRRFMAGFVRRTREVGRGIEMDAIFGINTRTPQYVRELILENGGDRDLAEIVEDAIQRKVNKMKSDDGGKPPMGKHRMDFNRNAGVYLTDQNTGERVFVRVMDLMETNAEHLFNGYIGGASGRIAAARMAGLKSDGDFNEVLNKVKAALSDERDRNNVVARAEETWKHLTGRPLEDNPDGFYARAGRVVRNYNMGRVGWTFGLAQIADLGNVVSIAGIRAFIGAMPELRSLMARNAQGRLTSALSRDFSEVAGIGNSYRAGSLYGGQMDEFIGAEAKVEFYARASGRAAAKWSGMAFINEGMQFIAAKLMTDKLAKGKMNAKRLAYLGLSEEDGRAISAVLKAHGTADGLPLNKMPPQLRLKFVHALRKASLRAVQENDWGATFPFMHRTTGKLLSQFRGFMLAAMSKQSLFMANHRDMESFATFAWSLFFGSLSYMSYVGLTKTPDEYEKYLEPQKLAAAAFTRSGWASALPMMMDTPVTFLGFEPMFSYRNSGLPSNAFTGIPAVELANRAQQAVSGTVQAAIDPTKDFTQRDLENWRRITPISSMWGVGHAINAAADGLNIPEE